MADLTPVQTDHTPDTLIARDPGDEITPIWFPYPTPANPVAQPSVAAMARGTHPAQPGRVRHHPAEEPGAPEILRHRPTTDTHDELRNAIRTRRVQLQQQLARALVEQRIRRVLAEQDPWDIHDPAQITAALAELDRLEEELR